MKGLIRNNFYSMQNNIKISFILATVLAITPFLMKDSLFIPISVILSVQIFLFITNTGASLHADEVAKWNKFELTLPVKRSTIIGAKYISFFILICFGFMMAGMTCLIASLISVSIPFKSILWGFEWGLTLSILSVAIMYPCMLKFGTGMNELIFLFSMFATIIIMLLIAFILSPVTHGMNWQHPLVSTVSLVVALLLFAGSYLLSFSIHRNREF